jgi:hypothetical protein
MRTYDWNDNKDMEIMSPEMSDFEVANRVRMIGRNDLDLEMVCVLGRDRIMCLVKEKAKLEKELADIKILCKEASDYLNYNKMTNIGHGSILHTKFKEASI